MKPRSTPRSIAATTGEPEAVVLFIRDISEQLRQENEFRHLAAIVEGSNDAICSISVHGVIKSWNKGAEQTYGYTKQEMIGALITVLHVPGQSDDLSEIMNEFRRGDKTVEHHEIQHKRKDGQKIFVSLMLSPIKDADGHLIGASAISRDISKEKLLAAALTKERNSITGANQILSKQAFKLARQANQMELLAEMTSLLQVCESDDEVYFVISQFAGNLFPDTSGALFIPGEPRSTLSIALKWGEKEPHAETFPNYTCQASHRAQAHLSCNERETERCVHLAENEGTFLCAPIVLRGELLGVMCLDWKSPDLVPEDEALTVRVLGDAALALSNLKLRHKLRELSIRDPLTGLFNRRYMEEFFEQELARSRRFERSMSVLLFDIDHFKRFNDTYGHEAGDAVLHDLGAFLRKSLRSSDVICRFGGEEIVIILPETPCDIAAARAEVIRSLVKMLSINCAGQALPPVTLSIGVASYPEHGDSFESLLKCADTALYEAKRDGRDRVCVASASAAFSEEPDKVTS